MLFAANIDTGEGDLRRASAASIRSDLGDAAVEFVPRGQPVIELGAASARSEIWKLVLYILGAVLAAELLFGWWIFSMIDEHWLDGPKTSPEDRAKQLLIDEGLIDDY